MKKQIKSLHLKNFQSHEDTILEFLPGLNVILGNSDSGKSAIVRGLRWLFYNEPMGADFLQRGKTQVEVTAEFYDGTILKRSRQKATNAYDLTLATGETMHFEGFGRTVPKEIVDYLNLRKFPLSPTDDLTLNIADQLEGPFLLQEKDSNKANAIGRLVGIHYIDQAQRNVNRDIKALNQDLKYEENSLEELLEKKKEYAFIEDKKKLLKNLQEIIEKGKKAEEKKEVLESFLNNYQAIRGDIDYCQKRLLDFKGIEELKARLLKLKEAKKRHSQLLRISTNYGLIQGKISQCRGLLDQVKDLNLAKDRLKKAQLLDKDYKQTMTLTRLYQSNEKSLAGVQRQLKGTKELVKAKNYLEEGKKTYQGLVQLKGYAATLNDLNQRFSIADQYFKRFTDFEKTISLTEAVKLNVEKLEQLKKLETSLVTLKTEKQTNLIHLRSMEKSIIDDKVKLETILTKLKICPICKRPMDEHTIETIISN
ncbi:MAG: AAA family ATPase [Peptoniphilus sp. oral taxon 375]|uniref:AAA family ATPase n=1 Tax=Urinicoccus timonensis TaxID=2024205 RepID=UPI000C074EAD|nr:AAA family ATPase [Urinicoccus timonensis]MBS4871328.1 AAA family ATPase [Peptoniphilus sp. oral taxon 375]